MEDFEELKKRAESVKEEYKAVLAKSIELRDTYRELKRKNYAERLQNLNEQIEQRKIRRAELLTLIQDANMIKQQQSSYMNNKITNIQRISHFPIKLTDNDKTVKLNEVIKELDDVKHELKIKKQEYQQKVGRINNLQNLRKEIENVKSEIEQKSHKTDETEKLNSRIVKLKAEIDAYEAVLPNKTSNIDILMNEYKENAKNNYQQNYINGMTSQQSISRAINDIMSLDFSDTEMD